MKKLPKIVSLPRVVVQPLQMGQYTPGPRGGVIVLDPSLNEQEHLDTLIHESLHCFAHYLDESAVEEIAEGISKVLWRAGYRLGKKRMVRRVAKARKT